MRSLLLSLILCSLISLNNGAGVTVDLIHRDSPLSPSHDPSLTRFDRLRNAIERSFARKSALLSKLSKPGLDNIVQAPITGGGGAYLMEYKIGTPPVRQLSIADTGSDLTWVQCQPCTECYKQNFPYFDPNATKTYRPVSCQSDICAEQPNSGCGDSNQCTYQISYGDHSYSRGQLAAETLTLGSATFPKFVIGCGTENAGTFQASGSGIFGLGNGAISFINQKSSSVNGKFSYCLISLDATVPSKISFGSDAVVTGPGVVSTPLVSKEPATFYYLTLNGISVGTEKFEYSRQEDDEGEGGGREGNIIIDSGTTLTFAPSDLYQQVESSLKSAIQGTPTTDPSGTFSLCYEGRVTSVPPITAHFEGADLELPHNNIFIEVASGVTCLSFLPSQDIAIFGNLHQAGFLIGYDLVKKQVSFKKSTCTKSLLI